MIRRIACPSFGWVIPVTFYAPRLSWRASRPTTRRSLPMKLFTRFALLAVAAFAAGVSAADDKKPAVPEGFTSLFNGKDLTRWKPTGKADVSPAEGDLIVC